jgi:ADP-ribose pyrophosphatase YjhB (NUDIX family)
MKNFPFQKDGKTYWYSRAIVCLSAVFCRDKDYNTYVLANQRGTATDKEVGKWNLPVGFLDFNETCAQCAAREVFEETGVRIDASKLKLKNINSKPDSGSQDVGFRYYTTLPGTID